MTESRLTQEKKNNPNLLGNLEMGRDTIISIKNTQNYDGRGTVISNTGTEYT